MQKLSISIIPDLYKLSGFIIMIAVSIYFFSTPVLATTTFSLDPSGTSHIGWMFQGGSSYDNTNATYTGITHNWHLETGSAAHGGPDYYAQDWNWGSGDDDCGKEVYAPFTGNIIYSGWSTNSDGTTPTGYGNTVVITPDADMNFAWRAAHLEDASLAPKGHINAGDYIGRIGNTSGTTSFTCHLHTVLYKNVSTQTIYGQTGLERLANWGSVVGDNYASGPDSIFSTPFSHDGYTASDNTAPTGQMISPTKASVLYNSPVHLVATASDTGSGVNRVEFFAWSTHSPMNSQWINIGVDTTAPYTLDWSFSGAWSDTVNIGMIIYDNAENSAYIFNEPYGTYFTVDTRDCSNYNEPYIKFFADPSCKGPFYTMYPGTQQYPLSFNNIAESIFVPVGTSIRIWSNGNRTGSTKCVTGTTWNFNSAKYDDGTFVATNGVSTISSVQVFTNPTCSPPCSTLTANGVGIYTGKNCSGTGKVYTAATPFTKLIATFNDKIQSFYVKSGWSARIYQNTNKIGGTQCLNATKTSLVGLKYTNGALIIKNGISTISAIKVYKTNNCK